MPLFDSFKKIIKEETKAADNLKTTLNFLLRQIELIKGDYNLDKIFQIIGTELKKIGISSIISVVDYKRENIVIRYIHSDDANKRFFKKKISLLKLKKYNYVLNKKEPIFCKERLSYLKKVFPEINSLLNINNNINSIILPLILKGESIGIIEIFSIYLTKNEVKIVNNFVHELVNRIANIILFNEVKKSEERYRDLFENAKEGFLILNVKSNKFKEVNKGFCEISGYTSEELRQMNYLMIFDARERKKIDNYIKSKLKEISDTKNPSMNFKTKLVAKRGGVRFIKLSVACTINNNEWFCIVNDITEQKLAEKDLRESEERYSLLVNNSLTGIYIDQGGRIVFCNKKLAEIYGYTKREIIGMESRMLVHKTDRKMTDEIRAKRLRGEDALLEYVAKGVRKNGEIVWIKRRNARIKYMGKYAILGNIVDVTKREQTARALKESEEKYKKLVNNANEAVIIINKRGFITFANKAFYKISGYQKDDLPDLHFSKIIHPEDYNFVVKIFNGKLQGKKQSSAYGFKIIGKTGEIRFVSYSGVQIKEEGKIVGLQAIIRDITEHKKLQDKIKKAKNHYEQVIDAMQDVIYVINKDLNIISFNKLFSKKVNLPINKIKNRECYKTIPRYENNLFKNFSIDFCKKNCYAKNVFESGKAFSIVKKNKNIFGNVHYYKIRAFPIKNKSGETYQILVIISDITKRKKAEEEIRRLNEFNKRILDNAPVSIVVLDKNGVIISVNDMAKRLTGKTDKQMIGRNLFKTKNIEKNKELSKYYQLLLSKGEPFYYDNMPYLPESSDRQIYLNIIAVPLLSNNKKVEGAISMAVDNTEAILAKHRLKNLNRNLERKVAQRTQQLDIINKKLSKVLDLKSKFISDASHELRTPLTIIQGNLDLAIREINNKNKEVPETFSLINKEIDRMASILTDLTILTNADSQSERVAYEKVNLDSLIKDVVQSLKVISDMKHIKIKHKKRLSQLEVMGDETKLEKLLINIVRNAIKYTNKNGWVKIELEKGNSEAKIIVEDNGVGIPEQDLPYIFERFYKIDKARSRNEGGTGLGLAICKWIAEAHNGKISVESKLGQGSKFTIYLPYDYKKQLEERSLF